MVAAAFESLKSEFGRSTSGRLDAVILRRSTPMRLNTVGRVGEEIS